MTNPFYKSAKWESKRKKILKRDGYQCQESKRYGKTVPATTVHHIFPLDQYPELALEEDNLISLGDKSHNTMHDRNTNAITAAGRQWQERVRDKLRAKGHDV